MARLAPTSFVSLVVLGPMPPVGSHEPDGTRQPSPSHFNGDSGLNAHR